MGITQFVTIQNINGSQRAFKNTENSEESPPKESVPVVSERARPSKLPEDPLMPAGRDATPSPSDENDNFCSILFFRNKTWNSKKKIWGQARTRVQNCWLPIATLLSGCHL